MAAKRALGAGLREVRIHLSQTAESSAGVRQFITKHYPQLKKENPGLPILVREASNAEPALFVRLGRGQEESVSLANVKPEQILDFLTKHGK